MAQNEESQVSGSDPGKPGLDETLTPTWCIRAAVCSSAVTLVEQHLDSIGQQVGQSLESIVIARLGIAGEGLVVLANVELRQLVVADRMDSATRLCWSKGNGGAMTS